MTTDEILQSRMISAAEAVGKIEDGEVIGCAGPSNLPMGFLSQLHRLKEYGTKNVTIFHAAGQVRGNHPYLTDPEMKGHLKIHATFYNKLAASVQYQGIYTHVPYQAYCGTKPYRIDSFVTACSPPDKHGFVRMSLGQLGEGPIRHQAKKIYCEINENFPYSNGDVAIHVSKVTWFWKHNAPLVQYPEIEVSDTEKKIGAYVASLIPDGSCVQLGIGGIPNAVSQAFFDKNDLGIHTEMLTTNMVRLAQQGVITGKYKNIDKEKMICAFAMGSDLVYEYINENPMVEIKSGNYVNNPFIIAQNDNMCSVNTAIQIDLAGQICSESFGSMQYSGIGGAMNFAQGAYYSKGGKAIIALKSTAKDGTVSTIRPILDPGAIVSIPRTLVNYVVTEYGIAEITNTSMQERVEALINIAHPDFREELREQAIERKITAW